MLRERNAFVLKARSEERAHALTLHVNVREQDVGHFNARSAGGGAVAVERLLALLDGDDAFHALVTELDNVRQVEQLAKSKAKDALHILESPDMKVQWQVSDEPGLPSVLRRVQLDSEAPSSAEERGAYRPLPMRKLAVSVWMYPPQVEIPATGARIPTDDRSEQSFFVGVDDDS